MLKSISINLKLSYLLSVCVFLVSTNLLAQDGKIDLGFQNGYGTIGTVYATAVQDDGKIILVGSFTKYNGTNANGIIRLNEDGTVDTQFNPGSGASNDVDIRALAIQADGKILIGGRFNYFNGVPKPYIARLNVDGSLDNSFSGSVDNFVYSIAIQEDQKILIGGVFSYPLPYFGRLNANGSIDNGFTPPAIYDIVSAIAIDRNKNILIGSRLTSGSPSNLIRLLENGSVDPDFHQSTGFDNVVSDILILEDNSILVAGAFQKYNGTTAKNITKIHADGSRDLTFNAGSGSDYPIKAIAVQQNSKIVAIGDFTTFNGMPNNRIVRLLPNGSIDNSFVTDINPVATSWMQSVEIQPDDKILLGGNFSGTGAFNNICRLNESGFVYGYVFTDYNSDCITDSVENKRNGIKLLIQPGNKMVVTNNKGFYYFTPPSIGNYSITIDTVSNWKPSCGGTQNFTVNQLDSVSLGPNFGLTSTNPCTAPFVSLSAPRLRRCFSGEKIYVQSCNKADASNLLLNAYTVVSLDSNMVFQGASLPYTQLNTYQYQFNLGDIAARQCIDFIIEVQVSCDAVLQETLCVEATLYPAENCVFDTIPANPVTGVLPCSLPWDKSSLQVLGWCQNDSIFFKVLNHGTGDMACYAPVRIYIDGEMFWLDSILLAAGEFKLYAFSGDGRTWRLEADQHPLHPGNSHPNASVEACGEKSNWTPNFINVMPPDDADPVKDVFCGLVRGSFDPNDKTGYPLGLGSSHEIGPNTNLNYVIRFQNTGNDTAYTVVVRDTLDLNLNWFSFQSGISSHPYFVRFFGNGIVEWTFDNILLPDSTTNEAESHGFVTFEIAQKPNLGIGTHLLNTAAIYFDFNTPVITNMTDHLIAEPKVLPSWNEQRLLVDTVCFLFENQGVIYRRSGTYWQVVSGSPDTLLSMQLTIKQMDLSVTEVNPGLFANASGVAYQWLNCVPDYQMLAGENNQVFYPPMSGSYAVILNDGECQDTSECMDISILGLKEETGGGIILYPNPASDELHFRFADFVSKADYTLSTLSGKTIQSGVFNDGTCFQIPLDIAPGVYFIEVFSGRESALFRVAVR